MRSLIEIVTRVAEQGKGDASALSGKGVELPVCGNGGAGDNWNLKSGNKRTGNVASRFCPEHGSIERYDASGLALQIESNTVCEYRGQLVIVLKPFYSSSWNQNHAVASACFPAQGRAIYGEKPGN